MKYRELLELYEKKALSEQEMEEISRDIEKQDAISEYLFEKDALFDEEEMQKEPDADETRKERIHTGQEAVGTAEESVRNGTKPVRPGRGVRQDSAKFVREVNRLIRRAFVKMGIAVGAIVLAVVLFINFALPHIISSFYYNPAEEVAETTTRFGRDLRVYTELTMPGYLRENVGIEERGYGNYDIVIYESVSYDGKFTNIAGTIQKGEMKLYEMNELERPTGNIFAWFQMTGDSSDSLRELVADGAREYSSLGSPETATEYLQALDEKERYLGYVTLDKMMPYEEFMAWVDENEYPVFWCAVCTENGVEDLPAGEMLRVENLGFICDPGSYTMYDWDREKYPVLMLGSEYDPLYSDWDTIKEGSRKESVMKTHFVSMLRYMAEQEEFLNLGGFVSGPNREQCLRAADYVEENGLMVYGCVAMGDKGMLLEMNEDAAVYEICAEEMR